MPLKKGAAAIGKLYKGPAAVAKVYRGAIEVYAAGGASGGGGQADSNLASAAACQVAGGWSINRVSGVATGTNAADWLRWNGILTPGVSYDFSYDYTKSSGSRLHQVSGGSVVYSPVLADSGTVAGTIVAGGSDLYIGAADALFTGLLSNIVIKRRP